ncbi:hypothetical protein Acor_62200 [Acrocarpospora corrugata]|uniref:Uncharacterized protein n=1 Tax=Acrocarpospora corrugata TaxID=35763 RepID=A0A5M3WAE1_9ACTN|nr:hypothetical protein Acor_62200 [Acrocarpospora corrugata]
MANHKDLITGYTTPECKRPAPLARGTQARSLKLVANEPAAGLLTVSGDVHAGNSPHAPAPRKRDPSREEF